MTRLSNRQYPMLQMFARNGFRMSFEDAKLWDQRPFRSMLIQGWVEFDGAEFHLTNEGREAWQEFRHTDIGRGAATAGKPLTAYFDAKAYGLDDGRAPGPKRGRAKVHTMRRRRAA